MTRKVVYSATLVALVAGEYILPYGLRPPHCAGGDVIIPPPEPSSAFASSVRLSTATIAHRDRMGSKGMDYNVLHMGWAWLLIKYSPRVDKLTTARVPATAMTIASIVTPKWISYTETTKSGDTVYDRIGLHRRCMSTSPDGCVHFPDEQRCAGDGGRFCNMWRTTGFLMSLAVVMELATIVGFLVTVAGGKVKREAGWRVLCGMLGVGAALQFGAMAVVVSLWLSLSVLRVLFADERDV